MGPVTTRVLLVEDDDDDYLLTRLLFREAAAEDLELDRVSTYEGAVAALDRDCHDVLLIDYRLGAHSGLDLMSLAASRGRSLPCILLTGHGSAEVEETAMKAGAADYLVKGRFDADTLVRSIRYALERNKVERRLEQKAAVIDGINQILLSALTCRSDEEVTLRSLEVTRRITGSEHAFMGEANASGGVDVVALAGPDGAEGPALLKNVGLSGAWEDAIREGRGVIGDAPLGFFVGTGGMVTGARLHSFLGVPLKQEARTLGFLGVANRRGGYDETDRRCLGSLAVAVAEALHRKRADALLRESQRLQRTLIATIPDPMWFSDLSHRILLTNEAMSGVFGFTVEDVVGKTPFEFAPLQAEALAREDDEIIRTGRLLRVGHEIIDAQGQTRWFDSARLLACNEQGEPIGIVGIARDVTERRRAEEKSLAQLAHTRLLNELAQAVVGRDTLESIYHVVVERLVTDLPAALSAVLTLDALADTLVVRAESSRGLSQSEPHGLERGSSFSVDQTPFPPCLDGRLIWVADSCLHECPLARQVESVGIRSLAAAAMTAEGKVMGILVVGRATAGAFTVADSLFLQQVSEHVALAAHHAGLYEELRRAYDDLRRTRKSTMQQERLRALGEMASGIAHDINNALSPVVCYPELLLDGENHLTDLQREYLEAIRLAGTDITQLVARMREFYRARDDQDLLQPLDLNHLVEQTIGLTRPRWSTIPMGEGHSIRFHTDLQADLPVVLGSEAEIREALTNLIFNGVDAMRGGGTLSIRTRQAPAEPTVHVEVIDSGKGMDDKTLEHCLEPFFTTKGEGGSGLGLAMVYGIMQRHEGSVEIESQVGQGTVVRLLFPVRAALEEAPSQAPVAAPGEAAASILCIDDDPILRSLLNAMLSADGHGVTLADGGKAGLDAFRKARARGAPFDVVITDLGMPDVSGRDVVREIKSESPGTPIILITGWGTRMGSEQTAGIQVEAVVSKPPKLAELRQAMRTVRDKKRTTAGEGQ